MYVFGVVLAAPMEQALTQVTAALQAEKLGVVSDVDVSAILKNKLGADIGDYRILGACQPGLAKRVIDAQPAAGVLLPCNLVLRSLDGGNTAVDFMDPITMLAHAEHPEIAKVAEEARAMLERVRDRLTS
jgi:uncharacterized protein (DUF302 family)